MKYIQPTSLGRDPTGMGDLVSDGVYRLITVRMGETCLGESSRRYLVAFRNATHQHHLASNNVPFCSPDMRQAGVGDNCTLRAYINKKGGVHSTALLKLVENLWIWTSAHLSLRALHLPGWSTEPLTQCPGAAPLLDEWLNPTVVEQVWIWFGTAEFELFTIHRSTHCPLLFSLAP